MKNLKLILILILIFAVDSYAQIGGTVYVGSGQTYTSFTRDAAAGLFRTINNVGLSSNLTVYVTSDITNEDGAILLNQWSTGSSYTVTILPSAATIRNIYGSNSSSLISLDGADNVTFDGRYSGSGVYFNIYNTNSDGSVIQMRNGATYNTIQYCKLGSRDDGTTGTQGTIGFRSTTNTTGNSYNTISYCEIYNSDATDLPVNGVYSEGNASYPNSNNTISNNKIYNFDSYGIYIKFTGNGNNWTITDNSIYYNATTSTATQGGIYFTPGPNSSGNTISGNYVGGTAEQCTGNHWVNSGNVTVFGIRLAVSTSTNGATVEENVIKKFRMTNAGGTSTIFYGIWADSGICTINNNTIGGSGADSIGSTGAGGYGGIYSDVSNSITITNNTVQYITMTASANATNRSTIARGILHNHPNVTSGTRTINIYGNTLRYLKSNGKIDTYEATLCGIHYWDVSTSSTANIYDNTLYDIKLTSTDGTNTYVAGIDLEDRYFNVYVYRNRIYNIFNDNTNGAIAMGITYYTESAHTESDNIYVYNNMISLITDQNTLLFGIADLSGDNTNNQTANVHYNSVYLGGTVTSGSNNSAAFNRGYLGFSGRPTINAFTKTKLKNNIFINNRSGGTGKHYAIINATNGAPTQGWYQNASNYNFLVANTSTVGGWGNNSITDYTFANWVLQSGTPKQDKNSWWKSSVTAANLFSAVSTADLSVLNTNTEAWYVNGKGIAGDSVNNIATDYYGNSRTTTLGIGTDIGANEFNATSTPENATMSGTIGYGNTITYTYNGRTLSTITWGSTGTLPSALTMYYYSGNDPEDIIPGANYSNAYYNFTPTGGSGYEYSITMYYDPAIMYTAPQTADLRLAKKEVGSSTWVLLSSSVPNLTTQTVSCSGLTGFSQFTYTDNNHPLPVELVSFTANVIGNNVKLNWKTSSEHNNEGFDVERKEEKSSSWLKIGFVKGSNNSNSAKDYSFEDTKLQSGKYSYRLKQKDYNGNFQYHNLESIIEVNSPDKFDLSQNYPNPFNPVTKIDYTLPADGKVTLRIYDITGKEIATLVKDVQKSGYYTVQFDAGNYASGIYIYKLNFENGKDNFSMIKKMVLVK